MSAQAAPQSGRGPYSSPRQEERQRRILDVARQEISRVGYDAITMQALAVAAGVSTKTLYNLYGSKDELLLAAVAELLGNLEQKTEVDSAEAGIPRLLAFTGVVFAQVVSAPRYAEVMARTLFQANPGQRLVEILLGNTLRLTRQALQAEQAAGGLIASADVAALAEQLAANQWGLILLWSKGIVALQGLEQQALRGQVLALLPLCSEARGKSLQGLLRAMESSGA